MIDHRDSDMHWNKVARYDELAQRIMLYHHLDATIEADVAEFGELRKVLFGSGAVYEPDQAGSEASPRRGKDREAA